MLGEQKKINQWHFNWEIWYTELDQNYQNLIKITQICKDLLHLCEWKTYSYGGTSQRMAVMSAIQR